MSKNKKHQGAAQPAWLTWLSEQVRLGVDFTLVHEILRKSGYPEEVVSQGLEAVRPRDSALVNGKLELPPLIRRAPAKLRRLDIPSIDVYAYEDFLSAKDCQRVINLVGHHLLPSPLAVALADGEFRTSQTCPMANLRSPVALALDAKICQTMGIRAEYGEGIQAQRYDVGQQFKPHCDFFEPGTDEYQRFAALRGNRSWTFMVYLNDGMGGGATRFTESGYQVVPKAGMALLWNNLREDGSPNPATKHCGEPVTQGCKVIITKWFRLNGDGACFST
jgi:prolyl 4-hydroxylase